MSRRGRAAASNDSAAPDPPATEVRVDPVEVELGDPRELAERISDEIAARGADQTVAPESDATPGLAALQPEPDEGEGSTREPASEASEPAPELAEVPVLMRYHVSGYRNGVEWPPAGGTITLPAGEAAALVAAGWAKFA